MNTTTSTSMGEPTIIHNDELESVEMDREANTSRDNLAHQQDVSHERKQFLL